MRPSHLSVLATNQVCLKLLVRQSPCLAVLVGVDSTAGRQYLRLATVCF